MKPFLLSIAFMLTAAIAAPVNDNLPEGVDPQAVCGVSGDTVLNIITIRVKS
jgi:hypothetical protein